MANEDDEIQAILQRFSPSRTLLLEWLKPRVDDSILHQLAQADYGYLADESFVVLRHIRDTLEIPTPLEWAPKEVLDLIRWSEPEDPNWRPGSHGDRGHKMRLFACAILIVAGTDPVTRDHIFAENDTLIQLVASALWLGDEAARNALSLLCWRVLNTTPEAELIFGEYPFFAMAILLLRVALFEAGQETMELLLLVEWVLAEETRVRHNELDWSYVCRSRDAPDAWLLGLTNFDSKHDAWRKVAMEVLLDPTNTLPDPAASALRGIAERIAPLGAV